MMSERINLLVLGDGDFSFSSCLIDGLKLADIKPNIITTCFDSKKDLIIKYPDSSRTISFISRSATIIYEINATKRLSPYLNMLHVDHVIFNFPHLGTENAKLHAAMIRHIFDRCRE